MKNIIEVKNLVKNYKEVEAVKNVSFNVKEGELFALLGTNGAGKSTTINIICTILDKTSGQIIVDGYNIEKNFNQVRERIGIVFQSSVLDGLLTVRENLETRASYYNIKGKEFNTVLEYLTDKLELGDFLDRRYDNLSGGQQRKADIARALIHNPKILFLDEPTTGLDPKTRLQVWELLAELREKTNMTVFLTTHYMEETANADTIVILEEGEIKAKGTPTGLKDKYSFDTIKLYFKDKEIVKKYLKDNKLKYTEKEEMFLLKIKTKVNVLEILNNLDKHLNSFEVIKGNMDTVFLTVTGRDNLEKGDI